MAFRQILSVYGGDIKKGVCAVWPLSLHLNAQYEDMKTDAILALIWFCPAFAKTTCGEVNYECPFVAVLLLPCFVFFVGETQYHISAFEGWSKVVWKLGMIADISLMPSMRELVHSMLLEQEMDSWCACGLKGIRKGEKKTIALEVEI